MQGKRTERVGHLIQMELSELVLRRVKDPRLGFVTITHVDVSPDLKSGRVFYSVLGDAKARKNSAIALEKSAGFLQKSVSDALKLRYTPKLQFIFDDSLEQGLEIDRVLRDISREKGDSL